MLKKNSSVHSLIMDEIRDVEKCVAVFENFMRAATTQGTQMQTLGSLCEGVMVAEGEADDSLRAMILSLSKGAYLPSTREDLIEIATSCDKIANKCETVARRIVQQQIHFPSEYVQEVQQIFTITKEQFGILEDCISMLFSQMHQLMKDPSKLNRIRDLESQVDDIEDHLYRSVFATQLELAAKMQIANIVELLCDLSDIMENIADKIQIMLIARKA